MVLNEFVSYMISFPTNFFFFPFMMFLLLMLVDLIFNVVENATADMDFFDLDNIPGTGLLLPPILSKVPVMVAMCTSFFIATVLSFYSDYHVNSWLGSELAFVADIISIPIVSYVALVISAWVLKPLEPFFDKSKTFAQVNFIGLKARVYSSKVTSDMGEVMVIQSGNEYLLDAVCEQNKNIKYGDEVVIVSRDSQSRRYVIVKK